MKRITVNLEVLFQSDDQAQAFVEALTGNDDDVALAAEKAINARLGYHGDASPIWLTARVDREEVDAEYVTDESVGNVRERPLFTNAFAIESRMR